MLALINLRSAGWKKRVKPNDETADITVLCRETTFKLHSELMCSKSIFFKVALDIPMTEKKDKRVAIREVDIKIFQKVIEFFYEDNLEFEMESELAGLLEAADRFDMEQLRKMRKISGKPLAHHLRKELSPKKMKRKKEVRRAKIRQTALPRSTSWRWPT